MKQNWKLWKCGNGGEWKIRLIQKIWNEELLMGIGERQTQDSKEDIRNCLRHLMREEWILKDAFEGMAEGKNGKGRRWIQLLNGIKEDNSCAEM